MKFAFFDESGKPADDVSVMAGIVIDAYKIHSTRREWIKLLSELGGIAGKQIKEFHMRDVYGGRKDWAEVPPDKRNEAIRKVLNWLKGKSGHTIVFSTTLKSAFDTRASQSCGMTADLNSRWICEAFHLALSINKAHRKMKNNKGKSVLVFDKGSGFENKLAELLVNPPLWSESYYAKGKKEEPLSEIMDTSFFADSTHAPLIQLADTIAFILRRLAEIRDIKQEERFSGELTTLESWVAIIESMIQPTAHRYKKTGRCQCADLFWELAPPSLREIA